mgnify:CR=1 FL=1
MTAVFFALLLSSVTFSALTLAVWGRHIGESAARYRVSWQPDGRAFSIWWLIYSTTFAAALVGLALEADLRRATLFLWSGTWVLTSIWVLVFDNQRNLVPAALVLLAAFGTSLAALFVERPWSSQSGEHILLCAPLGVLSGWLFLASAVNLGSAMRCDDPDFGELPASNEYQLRVYEDAARDSILARRRDATYTQVTVVVVLALAGCCLAIAIPDPVFAAPLLWGAVLQRGFPRSVFLWAALAIFAAGAATAVVRVFVWEF